jgi:thioredoxin 1
MRDFLQIGRIKEMMVLLGIGIVLAFFYACQGDEVPKKPSNLMEINGGQELIDLVTTVSEQRLMLVEFFATWCSPCKSLEPVLEELAVQFKDRVTIYKIDFDKHMDVAQHLGVSSIPHVIFIQKQHKVHSLVGLQPKAAYIKAIKHYSEKAEPQEG